jgi:hypothetical protein
MVVSLERVNVVPQAIKELVASQCAYKKRLAELRNRYVYSFGRSAEIGAKYIIERADKV